jgi:hypothetical protein
MIVAFLKFVGLWAVLHSTILATRADTWEVTVYVNGNSEGVWDMKTGGQVDSNEATFKPGGMAKPIALGGTKNIENLTLQRNYRLGRDHAKSQKWIDWVGWASVAVSIQPLDHDGNPWGDPIVYNGKLKRWKPPDHDSTSDAAAMEEIEVSIDGYPTGMGAGAVHQ